VVTVSMSGDWELVVTVSEYECEWFLTIRVVLNSSGDCEY
jgi:hypothetical protein